MKYIDIYNNIKNPLDNDEFLDELAKIYKERHGWGGFYGRLVKTIEKDNPENITSEEYDKFYADAFNKWKKRILSLLQEKAEKLNSNSFDTNGHKLIEYLKAVPDVKTGKEAKAVLYNQTDDKELNDALKKLSWDKENDYWTYVNSVYFNDKKEEKHKIAHRLYINVDKKDIYKIANEIIKKCDERELYYDFKFKDSCDRDDCLVIYSDTERLPLYIEVLQEIAKENPEIRQRCQRPPILTGQIDGWIGYGAEPAPRNGKNTSFNLVRSQCLEKAIEPEMEAWIQANKAKNVKYNGQIMSVVDYMTLLATEFQLENMLEALTIRYSDLTPQEQMEKTGYNEAYLANSEFKKSLNNQLKSMIQEILNDNIPQGFAPSVELPLQNGKNLKLYYYNIKDCQDLLAPVIMKNDKAFRKRVLENIKRLSETEGIDITNYCCDKDTKQKLIQQDQDSASVELYYQEAKKKLELASINAPRRKNKNETNHQYLEYLKQYVEVNKPKSKSTEQTSQTEVKNKTATSTQNYTIDENTQDLPKNNKITSSPVGAMTDEEIRASQIKLGFISTDVEPEQNYSAKKKKSTIKTETNNYQRTNSAIGMTEEEIRASQIKLGFISTDVEPEQNYSAKKEKSTIKTETNNYQRTNSAIGMTDEEIKASQKKIGAYKNSKRQ